MVAILPSMFLKTILYNLLSLRWVLYRFCKYFAFAWVIIDLMTTFYLNIQRTCNFILGIYIYIPEMLFEEMENCTVLQ